MASLSSLLPAPTQQIWDRDDERKAAQRVGSALVVSQTNIPPYGERKGWVPRKEEDFGDGGAFPEIHVAQYPLGMGVRGAESTSNALAVQLDESGKVKYSAIARQGHGADKIIYSKLTDLLPSEVLAEDDPSLQKPNEEDINEVTEKTRLALEKLTNAKISAAMPVKAVSKLAPAQYIRYTPAQQGGAFNSGAKQRVIRMVEAQTDPMEPPRFQINKKIPRAAPSPPAPVLHSPPRRVSVKQQRDWKVPPCVSHWKNAKGYTIPLDKRLAADGRGLQQVHINENFSKLAEALYIADRKAREAVEARAQLERRLAQREKEKKEEHLRMLAQRARDHRAGIRAPEDDLEPEDENLPAAERDRLRAERHKERQRDRNLARAAPDKRSKLAKDRERDISEQIALGLPAKAAPGSDAMFDQRLFNNSKGLDSGYGDDEAYNVYSAPWRNQDGVGAHIYRPTRAADNEHYSRDMPNANTRRFVADKEFAGTSASNSRAGPVQFEKDAGTARDEAPPPRQPEADFDPFGLDRFLSEAKRADKSSRKRDHRERNDDRSKKRRD
ncbi:Puff-specific protein Bx42 [Plutella xylostella]|uniref:Puff-specific protein Bx42 n=1 Tax=Plutella xylostella TaxID=51655 RepID=A0ABQ7PQI9_PLUXY|nr:puff-specific protein Bx42 [Plutella xylostella]XP_048488274.1 puff-specific protein Bx42 [Plutella xylostella]XP_048488275.1 puff-specific protein Bx42 [Plutella xylostella]KAG7295262.1 Puff-specific protein Bx42 [Plutella xylostella]